MSPGTAPQPALDPATGSLAAATAAGGPHAPTSAAPNFQTPVTLSEAPEALQRTIEFCARQGIPEARIELAPAALGHIQIHLQRTSDGVVARVVAGHEAAQSFQQGADDLRRSLQSHGLTLLRLDIESRTGGRAASSDSTGDTARTGGDRTSSEGALDESETAPVLAGGGGALVNVLA
jgi:flagellar hook-length control protein FliK